MTRTTLQIWAYLLTSFVLTLVFVGGVAAEGRAQRIVSVGGSVTEIVFALGEEHRLVARDITSNHPAAALDLPDVGYVRRLSPEGVLSVNPDLILAEEGAGPPEAVELLTEAAVPLVEIPGGFDGEAVIAKIHTVAKAIGVPEKGAVLAAEVQGELDLARSKTQGLSQKKVLFILALQSGRILAGGQQSEADGIIALAGGVNAMQGFEGYKPVGDEAISQSGAEVILMMARDGQFGITDEQLFSHPAISVTPAGQARSVVRMDGMLMLGFSVRTAQAITELASALQQAGS